jgi:hypothetical protein
MLHTPIVGIDEIDFRILDSHPHRRSGGGCAEHYLQTMFTRQFHGPIQPGKIKLPFGGF